MDSQVNRLCGGVGPIVVPMILPDFPEGVVGAGGAITVAYFFESGRGGVADLPHTFDPDFFAYATLNYHGIPAFLQLRSCIWSNA